MKKHHYRSNLWVSCVLIAVFCSYLSADTMADNHVSRWIADLVAADVENPLNASRRSLTRGERLFKQRCAVCHGEEGEGDGPGGKTLVPKPADLSSDFTQEQADGALFWKVAEGRGSMPGWKAILDDDERWNLVNFIKSLGAEGSSD